MEVRGLGSPLEIDALVAEVLAKYGQKIEATFHPIDENDPMRQMTNAIKW